MVIQLESGEYRAESVLFRKSLLLMTAWQRNGKWLSVSSSSRMCRIGDDLLFPQTNSWFRWAPLGSRLHTAVNHRELPLWLVRRTAGRHQYSNKYVQNYEIWKRYTLWSLSVSYCFHTSRAIWLFPDSKQIYRPEVRFPQFIYVGNFNI